MNDYSSGLKVVDQILLFKKLNSEGQALISQSPDSDEVLIYVDSSGNLIRKSSGETSNISYSKDQELIEIVSAEGYELLSITRDLDGVPNTATVKWPDGTAGVFTTVTKNSTWLSVDAFTVTYLGSTIKTVTQAAVTRDSSGAVITKPQLTVS